MNIGATEDVERRTRMDSFTLATSIAIVGEGIYVLCRIVNLISPDALVWFFQPWFHSFTLATIQPEFRIDQFVLGFVTFGISIWVVTYLIGQVYNGLRIQR